ncbi:hypothetical protein [Bartonella gabonensis]|uniref:hypothetical protein n=1 Tax=Bartonella gabonensis TaxID=2699889 RepID=UPI001FE4BE7A|nr:hypothetical protein [Bartonella gabonensis]
MCNGAGLLLHKCKDGGSYNIHGSAAAKWVWKPLRDVSLKQAREYAVQWRSVLSEGCAPIKEHDKQNYKAIGNLYYLKDIALDAFENRKVELKADGKEISWFFFTPFHIFLKLGAFPLQKLHRTEIRSLPSGI